MVTKICGVELEGSAISEEHKFAHLFQVFGLAIGCQPHDFIFISVMRKANVLRQRLIEHAQRMWEINSAVDINVGAATTSPCRARKVAETVD